jgi:hypothetical protein
MSAFNALNTAIYSTLSGGTALTALLAGTTSVYYLQAPDAATFDYVVWNWQAGPTDDNETAKRAVGGLAFVRTYSATSAARAGSIDAQIDALLHGKTLTVSGWANFWTAREESLSLVETDEAGRQTFMAGATYRVRLGKS